MTTDNGNGDRHNSSFLKELVRRRVFRTAGAYIVACWVLVQVASIVFPEFGAPAWAMRALIIMTIAGFPFVILLAWTVDVTSSGIVRTPGSGGPGRRERLMRGSVLLAASSLSGLLLWWLWTDYVQPTASTMETAIERENPVVAVSTPRMISGPEELRWLGGGIANMIRDELSDSRHLIVVSQSRWLELVEESQSESDHGAIAGDAGINFLVTGEILQTPGGIVVTSRIVDIDRGIELPGARLEATDAAGIIARSPEIAERVKQALRVPLEEQVERFTADFPVPDMDAYEAFVAGLAFFIDFEYDKAEQALRTALVIAPDYHMARFRLAEVLETLGQPEEAWNELERIPADAPLTPRERLYVEGYRFLLTHNRDPGQAITIYSELVAQFPYDLEAGHLLAEAHWLAYDEDASIREFRRLAEIHKYDPSSWMALGERLLDVGDLDEAAVAIDRYVAARPSDPFGHALVGNLALLQENVPASIEAFDRALEIRPDFVVAMLGLARGQYLDGQFDLAEQYWRGIVDNPDRVARYRIDAAFDLAGVLRGLDRPGEAIEVLQQVEDIVRQEGLYTEAMLALLGQLTMDVGDAARAFELVESAVELAGDFATRPLFSRAVLQLRDGREEALQATIAEIRSIALPPDDPDRTEEKAAFFLEGLSALQRDDTAAARIAFAAAHNLEGYEYALYALGDALLAETEGDISTATELAARAAGYRDPSDLRLDLEYDRAQARRLHERLLSTAGDVPPN